MLTTGLCAEGWHSEQGCLQQSSWLCAFQPQEICQPQGKMCGCELLWENAVHSVCVCLSAYVCVCVCSSLYMRSTHAVHSVCVFQYKDEIYMCSTQCVCVFQSKDKIYLCSTQCVCVSV